MSREESKIVSDLESTAEMEVEIYRDDGEEEPQPDSHHFIKLMERQVSHFEEQICDFEETMANDESGCIPDDVKDSIRATIGKARLLMSQKFVQFRGLCDANAAAEDADSSPLTPTFDDLAGFWDLVSIQVDQVTGHFRDLHELRTKGWKVEAPVARGSTAVVRKKSRNRDEKVVVSEKSKALDAARKKLIGQKKRQMRLKSGEEGHLHQVDIFLPRC